MSETKSTKSEGAKAPRVAVKKLEVRRETVKDLTPDERREIRGGCKTSVILRTGAQMP